MLRTLLVVLMVAAVPSLAEARAKKVAVQAPVVSLNADGHCIAPPVYCPARCVTYKHHRPCKKACCTCAPPVETVLLVKDPCVCGCYVQVPVCLPVCCTGVPEMDCKRGLLGRDVVEYEWCCGYRVKVVFDRRGDVTVHTYGS